MRVYFVFGVRQSLAQMLALGGLLVAGVILQEGGGVASGAEKDADQPGDIRMPAVFRCSGSPRMNNLSNVGVWPARRRSFRCRGCARRPPRSPWRWRSPRFRACCWRTTARATFLTAEVSSWMDGPNGRPGRLFGAGGHLRRADHQAPGRRGRGWFAIVGGLVLTGTAEPRDRRGARGEARRRAAAGGVLHVRARVVRQDQWRFRKKKQTLTIIIEVLPYLHAVYA